MQHPDSRWIETHEFVANPHGASLPKAQLRSSARSSEKSKWRTRLTAANRRGTGVPGLLALLVPLALTVLSASTIASESSSRPTTREHFDLHTGYLRLVSKEAFGLRESGFCSLGAEIEVGLSSSHLELRVPDGGAGSEASGRMPTARRTSLDRCVRLVWKNGAPYGKWLGVNRLPELVHHLGRRGTPSRSFHSFGAARLPDVYPGISLTVHSRAGELEHDWVVAPGADPASIRFEVTGADGTELDDRGNLIVRVGRRRVVLRAPQAYQELRSGISPVASEYRRLSDDEYG